ncbi:unnamed protein product [Allacma fusca]|uniref:Uncharacterized protein n=1 Tax=Allacma fusca TaxID=39272 RepID=A0A8J2JM01_9HEXA|nr:unnamed protein product [Allacma fusca]
MRPVDTRIGRHLLYRVLRGPGTRTPFTNDFPVSKIAILVTCGLIFASVHNLVIILWSCSTFSTLFSNASVFSCICFTSTALEFLTVSSILLWLSIITLYRQILNE